MLYGLRHLNDWTFRYIECDSVVSQIKVWQIFWRLMNLQIFTDDTILWYQKSICYESMKIWAFDHHISYCRYLEEQLRSILIHSYHWNAWNGIVETSGAMWIDDFSKNLVYLSMELPYFTIKFFDLSILAAGFSISILESLRSKPVKSRGASIMNLPAWF